MAAPRDNTLAALLKLIACLLCVLTTSLASAAEEVIATVTHLSGTLSVSRTGGTRLLGIRSEILPGDLLSTEKDTYARLRFIDGGEIVLRPNTQFKVDSFSYSENDPKADNMVVQLLKGGLRAVTGLLGKRSKEKVEFRTITATIGIRGTSWGMLLCDNDCFDIPTPSGTTPANGLFVDVTSGTIVMSNGGGTLLLGGGQFGFASGFTAFPVMIPPSQGVQVTMPQSISDNSGSGRSLGGPARDTNCGF